MKPAGGINHLASASGSAGYAAGLGLVSTGSGGLAPLTQSFDNPCLWVVGMPKPNPEGTPCPCFWPFRLTLWVARLGAARSCEASVRPTARSSGVSSGSLGSGCPHESPLRYDSPGFQYLDHVARAGGSRIQRLRKYSRESTRVTYAMSGVGSEVIYAICSAFRGQFVLVNIDCKLGQTCPYNPKSISPLQARDQTPAVAFVEVSARPTVWNSMGDARTRTIPRHV
jgi:hypothetical protein